MEDIGKKLVKIKPYKIIKLSPFILAGVALGLSLLNTWQICHLKRDLRLTDECIIQLQHQIEFEKKMRIALEEECLRKDSSRKSAPPEVSGKKEATETKIEMGAKLKKALIRESIVLPEEDSLKEYLKKKKK